MSLLVLYMLLLKASFLSFSGLGSLPMVRQDFVVDRAVLTDRQLNTAVVAGRTGPGPYGLYLVTVGYLVGGTPGAVMGFLALLTPSFLAIPLMRWLGAHADLPRIRNAIRGLVLASAGLLIASSMPLTQDALFGESHSLAFALPLMLGAFCVLTFTRINSAWLMAGAAGLGLVSLLFS